ncbi:hypothetical protein Leryth_016830 [Lithospermum erythrorhizon]|nr:hypothetical protein Leryth_016830 [Lithospermum erythrorhizon]
MMLMLSCYSDRLIISTATALEFQSNHAADVDEYFMTLSNHRGDKSDDSPNVKAHHTQGSKGDENGV